MDRNQESYRQAGLSGHPECTRENPVKCGQQDLIWDGLIKQRAKLLILWAFPELLSKDQIKRWCGLPDSQEARQRQDQINFYLWENMQVEWSNSIFFQIQPQILPCIQTAQGAE